MGFAILNLLGALRPESKKRRGNPLLLLCQLSQQHNGAVVAGVAAIMYGLHHLIVQGSQSGFGDHKIIQALVAFRVAPVLVSMPFHGVRGDMLGIQEMLSGVAVGLGAFQSVEISHDHSGQAASLGKSYDQYAIKRCSRQ